MLDSLDTFFLQQQLGMSTSLYDKRHLERIVSALLIHYPDTMYTRSYM